MKLQLRVGSAEDMGIVGQRLAAVLRPGDLVVLDGPLGAGKTTLTRSLGGALGVLGEVTSPTFVIARRHAPAADGPPLLHIDAYRASAEELRDQDLDLESAECVTVVEWGADKVRQWAPDRLEICIEVDGSEPDSPRLMTVRAVGPRWDGVDMATMLGVA